MLSGHVGNKQDYVAAAERNHRNYCAVHGYAYQFQDEFGYSDDWTDESTFVNFSWLKVALTLQSLKMKKWDYIFWIDSDSIFWNLNKSLDDLIEKGKDLVFTGDSWDVFNTGHFLVKNSQWSLIFFEKWLNLRQILLPNLETSHKGPTGRLVDQPGANILLASTFELSGSLNEVFNRINGYSGNSSRTHRLFHLTHAPTSKLRIRNTMRLINPSHRGHIGIVPQDRLNGYTFRLPGKKPKVWKAEILHFPGNSKNHLMKFAKNVETNSIAN